MVLKVEAVLTSVHVLGLLRILQDLSLISVATTSDTAALLSAAHRLGVALGPVNPLWEMDWPGAISSSWHF